MRFVHRSIQKTLLATAAGFPALILTGPRRSGKTFLLRRLFAKADYRLLEDPDVLAAVQADPRGFLEDLKPPVILDEIQNAPQLFPYVRSMIDAHPSRKGQWLFTGSQEAPLMRHVTESMAGRAAILQLLPFSFPEIGRIDLLRGGFPEVWAAPRLAEQYFASYIQTYLERDIRAQGLVHDLPTFRRFLSLLATRHGQILNRSDLAAPLGVSIPTIGNWIDILEMTGQIILLQPYFENFGKRLIKSPKVYFMDSGLLCNLLQIRTQAALNQSPFAGPIFEGMLAAEFAKHQASKGQRRQLYFFRDQQGLEIDFVLPGGDGGLTLIEAKYSRTPTPAMARPLLQLGDAIANRNMRRVLVYRASRSRTHTATLAPGVELATAEEYLARLP